MLKAVGNRLNMLRNHRKADVVKMIYGSLKSTLGESTIDELKWGITHPLEVARVIKMSYIDDGPSRRDMNKIMRRLEMKGQSRNIIKNKR